MLYLGVDFLDTAYGALRDPLLSLKNIVELILMDQRREYSQA
ncbi:hypothetical protein HCUR_00222 [Holospora curviuscula]|uniref:Uncharacterized protein n=1 Tax=Holospora curviuscula TaxID=1082868 RepID=A0A2S5RE33_9PROT|nr:hypothetical protein HCUR_00222 [Holospora curviuscula]